MMQLKHELKEFIEKAPHPSEDGWQYGSETTEDREVESGGGYSGGGCGQGGNYGNQSLKVTGWIPMQRECAHSRSSGIDPRMFM